MLSAPHSVLHKRNDSIRPRETRTKDIVKKLSKDCNTYSIYKLRSEYNDANWDEKCEYTKTPLDYQITEYDYEYCSFLKSFKEERCCPEATLPAINEKGKYILETDGFDIDKFILG